MNPQIVKNVNNKFNLHDSTNRNREHLTDFTQENGLTFLNTKFQKRKGKRWTNTYLNNTKTHIDYTLMNKKWINSSLNCEAYSAFKGVSSDHRIVPAKERLCLRRNVAQTTTTTTTTTTQYDWSLLNNRDISDIRCIQEISETLTPSRTPSASLSPET